MIRASMSASPEHLISSIPSLRGRDWVKTRVRDYLALTRPHVLALVLFTATPALADPWYAHYANAEKALKDQDWPLAVQELNEALVV